MVAFGGGAEATLGSRVVRFASEWRAVSMERKMANVGALGGERRRKMQALETCYLYLDSWSFNFQFFKLSIVIRIDRNLIREKCMRKVEHMLNEEIDLIGAAKPIR